jgi:putative inorganic carbon (hco3(-)) transporter
MALMHPNAPPTTLRLARRPGRRPAEGERLTFNSSRDTVPRFGQRDHTPTVDDATFATAPSAGERDWGYFGLLAFTAVLLLRPQDRIPGLATLHLAEVCAIIGIGPMLLHRFAHRLPVFRITPETTALVAFGLVILATAPFSIWPGGAFEEFTDSYLKVVLVFVLMMNTLTTPARLERLTWLIVLAVGYIAASSVFDYARGVNLVESGRLAGSVGGLFGNPNDLALNMVSFMPAAAIFALSGRHAGWRRLAAAAIVVLMGATIVFTKSRGGVLGLLAMLATLVWLGSRIRPSFGVIAVVAVLAASPFLPASFWTRMTSIVDSEQDKQLFTGSSEARRIVMLEGIEAFMQHPLTGVGAGQFKNYNPPERQERWRETHNVLIQAAAETGIAGLMIFTFLIYRALRSAVWARRLLGRAAKRAGSRRLLIRSDPDWMVLQEHSIALSAGLVGWLTCAMFASVAYNWTFYYLLALIVATRELARRHVVPARAAAA